jgi:hypothetical protein
MFRFPIRNVFAFPLLQICSLCPIRSVVPLALCFPGSRSSRFTSNAWPTSARNSHPTLLFQPMLFFGYPSYGAGFSSGVSRLVRCSFSLTGSGLHSALRHDSSGWSQARPASIRLPCAAASAAAPLNSPSPPRPPWAPAPPLDFRVRPTPSTRPTRTLPVMRPATQRCRS